MIDKEDFTSKLKTEIDELGKILKILQGKKPNHPFLFPTIGNAIVAMTESLIYLEGKNPYYPRFYEDAFGNRQAAMHRSFFGDLHIGVEDGLRKIISENEFRIRLSRQDQAASIIKSIKEKLPDVKPIDKDLNKIAKLVGRQPSFDDYLNTVLNSISSLDDQYRKEARTYFGGLSIIRNKVSHSDMSLTNGEKKKLTAAKLGHVISEDGGLQMTFEGYRLLIKDAIGFFDNLYAHL